MVFQLILQIPTYVSDPSRSKITIVALDVSPLSMRNGRKSYEKSFFFTVTEAHLNKYDGTPPVCVNSEVCDDLDDLCEGTNATTCSEISWSSYLEAADNITGLKDFSVDTNSTEIVVVEPMQLGSRDAAAVRLTTTCCARGVAVRVRDMAENEEWCIVGEDPNGAERATGGIAVAFMLMITMIK